MRKQKGRLEERELNSEGVRQQEERRCARSSCRNRPNPGTVVAVESREYVERDERRLRGGPAFWKLGLRSGGELVASPRDAATMACSRRGLRMTAPGGAACKGPDRLRASRRSAVRHLDAERHHNQKGGRDEALSRHRVVR
jgi:hypothetical protein